MSNNQGVMRPKLLGNISIDPYPFQLDIESISIDRKSSPPKSIILLNTTFKLNRAAPNLKHARIVMTVHPNDLQTASDIDILDYFPNGDEFVEVLRGTGKRTIAINPTVTGPGSVAVQAGSYTSEKSGVFSYHICLSGIRKTMHENEDPQIEWIFKDDHGVYFPSTTKVLLVVTGSSFDLCFKQPPISVKAHSTMKTWFSRQEKLPSAEWRFCIDKDYKQDIAEKAFIEYCGIRTIQVPPIPVYFGLRRAALSRSTAGQNVGAENPA